VKFAVIGDFGDGSRGDEVGAVMGKMRAAFDFISASPYDNICGSERPQGFKVVELPSKARQWREVHASLGSHDTRTRLPQAST
jgi:hypothetical protein